ncbi:hypothetical protein [Actinoplanes regularis]|uniref:hypothetical protein n=1 Tax=Actinoplanes regularis TaxID=52697 RepID=UPI0024A25EC5|nr:hypothetical protein [Actinoplanes regularis]GLW28868.1 hypothetical protein Areg01_18080 [Actinoplanes regularis]
MSDSSTMAPAASPTGLELERLRWEIAALTGRMRSVELERDSWRARCDRLTEQRDRERERCRRLSDSGSYRLGRALVSFAKEPLRTSPRLIRGLVRRLRPGRGGTPAVPGQATRAPSVQRRPAHLYVAIGLDHDALRDLLVTINQRLLVTPDHRPVVLTDDPAFSLLRKLGVVLEYLPDRATWERHRPGRAWDDLLAERLAQLCRAHDTELTVVVDRLRPPTLVDLLRA